MKTKRKTLHMLVPALAFALAFAAAPMAFAAQGEAQGGSDLAAGSIFSAQAEEHSNNIADTFVYVEDATYTGKPCYPEPTVWFDDGTVLDPNTDYDYTYSDNVNAGIAAIWFTGTGDYTGTRRQRFEIKPADIAKATASAIGTKAYTGSAITPVPTLKFNGKKLVNGTDFTLSYSSNKNVGTATVKVTGKGNFTGTKSLTFKIGKADASRFVVAKPAKRTYTGKAYKPSPSVTFNGKKLKKGRDYKISYKDNKNAGKAQVIVKGMGSFTGSKTVKFAIVKASVSKMKISKIRRQFYTGKKLTPAPTVKFRGKKLKKGRDYTLVYKNNVNIGQAKVYIKGTGNFKGKRYVEFHISKSDIEGAVIPHISARTYTGEALTPKVIVKVNGKKLKKGRDFTVTYKTNVNAGRGQAVVKGINNYKGRRVAKFKILPASLDDASIASIAPRSYTGKWIQPNPRVTFNGKVLSWGKDYSLEWDDNKQIGTARVTIIGKGNFTDTRYTTFNITRRSIIGSSISNIPEMTYTGYAIEPNPVIWIAGRTLVRDVDYTLSYSNNINPGTAYVYVQGRGNYVGRVTIRFNILPKQTTKAAA